MYFMYFELYTKKKNNLQWHKHYLFRIIIFHFVPICIKTKGYSINNVCSCYRSSNLKNYYLNLFFLLLQNASMGHFEQFISVRAHIGNYSRGGGFKRTKVGRSWRNTSFDDKGPQISMDIANLVFFSFLFFCYFVV